MSKNRKIGVSCLLLSSGAGLSSFSLKGILPYSGIIGWTLAVIFILASAHFIGKDISKS
ncbi:hypothetical protein [Bacillus cereus group sp. BfR-BA-01380]|uniref:hypothetical protein n=1 Tax=Bacillus cereus group sp. BfR-BA-01380 TaxID=2920324 RepID=UPI001F576C7A|nr:hypothetical protein [Bacillus cereus group sp. BfR-BA-01380]